MKKEYTLFRFTVYNNLCSIGIIYSGIITRNIHQNRKQVTASSVQSNDY